jgi:hypothetical protein
MARLQRLFARAIESTIPSVWISDDEDENSLSELEREIENIRSEMDRRATCEKSDDAFLKMYNKT